MANRRVQKPTYSYIGHNPQLTYKVRRRVEAKMANSGRNGAPLLALMHTTVAQNVGGLSYAVAPGVGLHGGRGMTVTAKVGGAQFS
jgi:hypothetical protein